MTDRPALMDEMGAVDAVVIELPDTNVTGELIPTLLDLVDREMIRVLDALLVVKDADGSRPIDKISRRIHRRAPCAITSERYGPTHGVQCPIG